MRVLREAMKNRLNWRLGAISPEKVAGVVIGFVVIMIILSALLPTFIQSTNTLSSTIANETSLQPVKPLVDNLPLLFVLGVVIGLVFATIKIYKSES